MAKISSVKLMREHQLLCRGLIKLTLKIQEIEIQISPLELMKSALFRRLNRRDQYRVCFLAGIECTEKKQPAYPRSL